MAERIRHIPLGGAPQLIQLANTIRLANRLGYFAWLPGKVGLLDGATRLWMLRYSTGLLSWVARLGLMGRAHG